VRAASRPDLLRRVLAPARERARRLAPAAVAFALVVHTLFATPLVAAIANLWQMRGSDYADARVRLAFAGVPIDDIRASLDATLSRDSVIALSPAVMADPFLEQRLAEGLYPRRIDRQSPNVLDVVRTAAAGPADAQALGSYGDATLVLRGPPLKRVNAEPRGGLRAGTWLPFLVATCSAGGWGLLVVAVARIESSDPLLVPSTVLLAGAVAIGLLTSVATWLQLPLAGLPLGLIGFLAGAAAVWRLGGSGTFLTALRNRVGGAAGRPENWVLVAALLGVLVRMALLPMTLWDGRSIWLLRAHQIRDAGRFALTDALHPDYAAWTHPSYPLLLPGWLAHFTAFSGGWDERAAGLGIAVLLAAVVPLDWGLARARLGRWLGAAFVLSVFSSVGYLTAGAYADGFLVLLLLLALLALASPAMERVGWLAAAAASLLKDEGLVLGAIVAVTCLLSLPHLRARRPARRFLPLLVFVPMLMHMSWTRVWGVPPPYVNVPWRLAAEQWQARLGIILAQTWNVLHLEGYTRCHALLWAGMGGALVTLGGAVARTLDRVSRTAIVVAALSAALAFLALMRSPFDLWWHTSTAVDRLLLHAAAFALLAALGVVAACAQPSGDTERTMQKRDPE